MSLWHAAAECYLVFPLRAHVWFKERLCWLWVIAQNLDGPVELIPQNLQAKHGLSIQRSMHLYTELAGESGSTKLEHDRHRRTHLDCFRMSCFRMSPPCGLEALKLPNTMQNLVPRLHGMKQCFQLTQSPKTRPSQQIIAWEKVYGSKLRWIP